MKEIKELTPYSSLRDIVNTMNAFIEAGNINTKTLMALTKSHQEPIKVFQATPSAIITGEVYVLETSGIYSITTTGNGRTKIILKDGVTNETIDYQILDNSTQSAFYLLSEGDKLYIHSSPVASSTLDIKVYVTETMFDIISLLRDGLESVKDNQVNTDELTRIYTETLNQVTDYLLEIKNARISLANGLNFPVLRDRLEYIDKQIIVLGGGEPVKRHNWLNILDCNVKGDGTTDDAAAINTAINNNKSNQVIYMPKRTYIVKSTVIIPEGTTLICDGTIKCTANIELIVKITGSNCDVKIASIIGNGFNTQRGLSLQNSGVTLENSNVQVNSISNVNIGITLKPTGTFNVIQGCYIKFNSISAAIGILFDGGDYNAEILQNTIQGGLIRSTLIGVKAQHSQELSDYITGNKFYGLAFQDTKQLFNLHGVSDSVIEFSIKQQSLIHTLIVDSSCKNINFVSMSGLNFSEFNITGTNILVNYQNIS